MPDAVSEERWQAILQAYREQPGVHAHAQRAGNCDWRTARKLWERGSGGRRPMREILAEEAVVRRSVWAEQDEKRQAEVARLRDEILADQERTLARVDSAVRRMDEKAAELDALKRDLAVRTKQARVARAEHGMALEDNSRSREFLLAHALRDYIRSCLGVVGEALTPDVVINLGQAIKRGAADGSISSKDAMTIWRSIVAVAKPLAEAAESAARLERMAAGSPTTITRTEVAVDLADVDELEVRARAAATILRQVQDSARRFSASEDAVLEEPPPAAELPAPEAPACDSAVALSQQPEDQGSDVCECRTREYQIDPPPPAGGHPPPGCELGSQIGVCIPSSAVGEGTERSPQEQEQEQEQAGHVGKLEG